MPSPEYLIDPILPAETVNLIIGASGAGKTTLMFQWLSDWVTSGTFFSFPCHPVPVCYIALDRTEKSIRRTMARLNVPQNAFPVYSILGRGIPLQLDSFLKLSPESHLFVIEGISRMVTGKGINDYAAVADFLCAAQVWCERNHRTIVGSAHASKVKEGQRYMNPRERVMGSGGWPAYSETNFFLECPPDSKDPAERDLWILPRNSEERRVHLCFNGGRLVETPQNMTPAEDSIWQWIGSQKGPFAAVELVKAMDVAGISRATVFRALTRLVEQKLIMPVEGSKGLYRLGAVQ